MSCVHARIQFAERTIIAIASFCLLLKYSYDLLRSGCSANVRQSYLLSLPQPPCRTKCRLDFRSEGFNFSTS